MFYNISQELIEKYNKILEDHFVVEEIPFSKLNKWYFEDGFKCLRHDSGKFFKIEGIHVKTNYGNVNEWTQPIINQAEIGILGIITKVFEGKGRCFLMQLKMEPGNINFLQLSPTVQATKSNFSQVHKGKSTLFLEYFIERGTSKILIDQLQSEQGGRFLRKRNRNMIVEIDQNKKLHIPNNFVWLTLDEIRQLIKIDNFVNMDARSVLSTIISNRIIFDDPIVSDEEFLRWYTDQKVYYELDVEKIPLNEMHNWHISDEIIYASDRFFSVIAIKVESGNREVSSWTQPIIKDKNIGLIGFITQKINGTIHYLIQTKVMPGNIDIIDLSPSISVSNYKYLQTKENKPLFFDYFINNDNVKIIYDIIQSEEGGRFYHLQNRNMIIEINENEKLNLPSNYMWITKEQISKFMPRSMFNIEARSLIAAIL